MHATRLVVCISIGRGVETADERHAKEALESGWAALVGLKERARAEAAGSRVVIEAHIEVFNTGANDAKDRGSEANGGDRGGGP